MAHNIYKADFVSHRKPAWHGLGTVLTERVENATAALAVTGIDRIVFERAKVVGLLDDGTQLPMDAKGIVVRRDLRDGTVAPLAVLSQDFPLIQNTELAALLDPLCAEWPVETVGALGNGSGLFITLDAGEFAVLGKDPVRHYFLLSEWRDGTRALAISDVTLRVVCNNTLDAAEAGAVAKVTIAHVGRNGGGNSRFADDAAFYVDLLAKLRGHKAAIQAFYDKLATTTVTPKQAVKVFEQTYPLPPAPRSMVQLRGVNADEVAALGRGQQLADKLARAKAHIEYWTARREAQRKHALDTYERFNAEQAVFANTGWAVLNAVTEVEDHRVATGPAARDPRQMAHAAMFGDRAATKQRAVDALRSALKLPRA